MAVEVNKLNKHDTSLWLHNKLGNVNDLWSGSSIVSQLDPKVLKNIRDCFPDLQSLVKLKLLCSFLHLPRRNVEQWKSELEEIVEVASIDSDQWVSMVAELLKSFPEIGNINFNVDENASVFTDLINDLKKSAKKPSDQAILPIESLYLNTNAFIAQIGAKPQQPVKHFTLRRKPKSAALRAELLHKSNEVATNTKKNSTTHNVAARYRGSKELNDSTPLKGIPSRTSFGSSSISTFKTPNPANRSAGSVRNPTRPTIPGVRRDGGIKLLDIGEQPLNRDAKRKKRNQEEAEAKQKEGDKSNGQQQQQDSTATPDYALGLTSMVPPSPAPAYSVPPTPGPYMGESSTPKTKEPPERISSIPTTPTTPTTPVPRIKPEPSSQSKEIVSSSPVSSSSTLTTVRASTSLLAPSSRPLSQTTATSVKPQASDYVQITIVPNKQTNQVSNVSVQNQSTIQIQPVQRSQMQQQSMLQSNIQQIPQTTPTQVATTAPIPTTTTTPPSASGPRLQLSQKQIMEAQELFKNSNNVGKVEKALILSFMGGSRENPCPHLGDIVTIKLNEKEEQIRQPDGTIISVIAENHYQMNYSTGEAKQIKKLRKAE